MGGCVDTIQYQFACCLYFTQCIPTIGSFVFIVCHNRMHVCFSASNHFMHVFSYSGSTGHVCYTASQRVPQCGPHARCTFRCIVPQSGHFISAQTHTAGFVWFAKSMQPHRNKSNHEDAGGLDESNVEFESDANHCFYCMTLCDHFLIQSKPFCHQKLLILFCTRSTFDWIFLITSVCLEFFNSISLAYTFS